MAPFFRHCIPLGFVCFALTSVAQDDCRSNTTHVAWHVPDIPSTTVRRSLDESSHCQYQTMDEAKQEAYQYLRDNIMPFDLPFLETLGFHDGADDALPDGLDDGMVGQTIAYALHAKQEFPYSDGLPKEIWQELEAVERNIKASTTGKFGGNNNLERPSYTMVLL